MFKRNLLQRFFGLAFFRWIFNIDSPSLDVVYGHGGRWRYFYTITGKRKESKWKPLY